MPLLDSQARTINYLRLSITDRCNERCLYCLPEGFSEWKEREEILSYEELLEIARVAVGLGIPNFRVTGGEPLVRRDAEHFVHELLQIPGIGQVGLSTNATRLAAVAPMLARSGLHSVNISLDALNPAVYQRITGGSLELVLQGIEAARAARIPRIKLNTVLMRGINEQEILPLVEFAAERQLLLRFIELMPVSLPEVLNEENFFPVADAQRLIATRTALIPTEQRFGNGPARYFNLPEFGSTVGFIGALTNLHFCDSCNKMRVTADGKLRPCLGNHDETDLKPALRPVCDPEMLRQMFLQTLRTKPAEHLFRNQYQAGRIMTAIGG
jgi:cyclic pyranopterin phosphate synthase